MAVQGDLIDYLVYGIDLKNRRLYFGAPMDWAEEDPGHFNGASIELSIRALHKMSSDAPGKPIEIHMNSVGGSPYDMLRLHDEILASPCQIKFYGGGAIMSAATWIMAVSDERNLHKNTTIMVHDGFSGFEGKCTDLQIWATEEKRLMDILYDIYTTNSRMPKEFWEDVCQRDLYLSAGEAVSLGLADKIIEPKKRGNLRKARQLALKKKPDAAEMRKLMTSIYSRIDKKKVPKIEFNEVVKEPVDPHLVIDDKPVEIESPQPVKTEAIVEPDRT